jgi:hypothetical protein
VAPRSSFRSGASRSLILAAVLTCLLCPPAFLLAAQSGASPEPKPEENAFNDRVAAQLLNQIAGALVAHNQKNMLGAFDLGKMNDGPLFRQQIASFFADAVTIRAHLNLVQAAMETGKGVATVDVEMEAVRRDDSLLPVHKQAQLRFVAEKSSGGWKFTDVQPRTFFSTSQP